MLLSLLRLAARPTLALGGLPAAQQPEAFWLLAVALVPRPRQKNATTASPVTNPRRKPAGPRRAPTGSGKLFLSHGRWCSRRGRPRDWPLVPRAPLCGRTRFLRLVLRSLTPGSLVQYTQHAPGQPAASHLGTPVTLLNTMGPTDRYPCRASSESEKREGNEEEDRLELARPSKETNPRKETAEEKEGNREVPSCPTAGVTCTQTAGDSRAGPKQVRPGHHGVW